MRPLLLAFAAVVVVLIGGCHSSATDTTNTASANPHEQAAAANALFLSQKAYDPWVLTSQFNPNNIASYHSNGKYGYVSDAHSNLLHMFEAGHYVNGSLYDAGGALAVAGTDKNVAFTLNLHDGTFTTQSQRNSPTFHSHTWRVWQNADIVIGGDPQAQQVTHANLFYLLSSTFPGSTFSIPPMGLSSAVYGGHIFWDADVWMLPALLPQHPEYAKSIINYRAKLLAQARRNAAAHGFAGAEFPWESADTGKEVAPAEFARERHITADVGWAAWQYYLWTGDKAYLQTEGWPLLRDTANYWVSRVTHSPDGQYHINTVLSPDETAGVVNDDAWTNAVVAANLRAAARAAALLHQPADPQWTQIASHLARPFSKTLGIPQENSRPLTPRFAAKQADTLLLIHPLHVPFDPQTEARMLDYYLAHTIATGPAMTASIHAIVAANLGRSAQSLADFRASYQPFERGRWDAFSEKRTTNNVYFLTGMAGCVQAVLYGFAGLQVVEPGQPAHGTRLAGDSIAALYADPHLPPGWTSLTVQGIHFRGHTLTVTITPGNRVTATKPGNAKP